MRHTGPSNSFAYMPSAFAASSGGPTASSSIPNMGPHLSHALPSNPVGYTSSALATAAYTSPTSAVAGGSAASDNTLGTGPPAAPLLLGGSGADHSDIGTDWQEITQRYYVSKATPLDPQGHLDSGLRLRLCDGLGFCEALLEAPLLLSLFPDVEPPNLVAHARMLQGFFE